MLFRVLRTTTALVTVLCASGWAADGFAQTSAAPSGFTIEAQDLNGALVSLSRASKRNILFDPAIAAGKRAVRVERASSFEDALRQLLNGTGLRFEITADGSAIVLRQEAKAPGAPVAAAPPREARRAPEEAPPEELVVTGSRIRGAVVASPVIAQTQKQILDAGLTSLGEVVRALPQNFNGGQNPGIQVNVPETRGTPLSSSSAINLRGLGADATLTLLNGHRLAYNAAFQGIDLSVIPVAAVDRIEIVADGSSALYGSDAVAGVANIILRRDYDGIDASARFGLATDGGYQQQQYSLVGGTVWNGGGFIASYDYEFDKPILASQRAITGSLNPGQFIYPELRHNSVTLGGHQDITDDIVFEFDGFFNKRWSHNNVPRTPTGTLFTNGISSFYTTQAFAIAPSLKWMLGHWQLQLQGVYGSDEATYGSNQYSNGVPSQILGCYCNNAKSAELNADGPLFDLPAGAVRAAIGAGVRSAGFHGYRTLGSALNIDVSQGDNYAFGEVNVPVVAAAQRIPFIDRLSFSGAVRYEDYPGVDSVATPKIGLVYAPIEDIEVKGSWGKSFKAPTSYQRYLSSAVSLYLPSQLGGSGYPATATAMLLAGGNTDLKPERATTWSATISARPRWVEGLHLELSYFNVDYTNRIVAPITSLSQSLATPIYANLVTLNPTLAQQAAVLAGRTLFPSSGAAATYNPASVVALIDDRNVNASQQSIHGIDIAADYALDLRALGKLTLTANASYLESTQQLSSAQPTLTLAGTIYNPPHWRGRAGAVWERGGLTASSYFNFVGGVKNAVTTPALLNNPQQLAAMKTIDFAMRYRFSESWARGLNFGLSVQNFFNAKPDFAPTTVSYYPPFDSTNYSAIGRFISLTVSKSW